MNKLYKLLSAVSNTLWIVAFYGIKEEWTIWSIPTWFFGIILIMIPIILSGMCLLLTSSFSRDTFENCSDLKGVSHIFLPIYFVYILIGFGAGNLSQLIFGYLFVLGIVWASQTQCFNPVFLLFGYSFYETKSDKGTNIMLITRRKLRNPEDVSFDNLRRINDSTFIAWKNIDEE